MQKVFFLCFLFFAIFSLSVFAQDQTHSIRVNSISIATDRGQITSGFGSFSMNATDESGNSFDRSGIYGHFSAAFVNCLPCRKTTAFGNFFSNGWLTSGSAQSYNEWTQLDGLEISAPTWMLPVQQSRNRPLIKYIPVTIKGKIKVVDARPIAYRIINTDSDVKLTGVMRVEFRQSNVLPTGYEWKNVQVTATKTP